LLNIARTQRRSVLSRQRLTIPAPKDLHRLPRMVAIANMATACAPESITRELN
jgi:hypothetical protein